MTIFKSPYPDLSTAWLKGQLRASQSQKFMVIRFGLNKCSIIQTSQVLRPFMAQLEDELFKLNFDRYKRRAFVIPILKGTAPDTLRYNCLVEDPYSHSKRFAAAVSKTHQILRENRHFLLKPEAPRVFPADVSVWFEMMTNGATEKSFLNSIDIVNLNLPTEVGQSVAPVSDIDWAQIVEKWSEAQGTDCL